MEIEISSEPHIGWRYWNLGRDLALQSCFRLLDSSEFVQEPIKWPVDEELVSVCFEKCDDTPLNYCTNCAPDGRSWKQYEECTEDCPRPDTRCGICAFEDFIGAMRLSNRYKGSILGKVALWGNWVLDESDEGINFYRAHRAYPQKLYGGACRECSRVLPIDSLLRVRRQGNIKLIDRMSFFRKDQRELTLIKQSPFPYFVCREDSELYARQGLQILPARPVFEEVAEKYGIEVEI